MQPTRCSKRSISNTADTCCSPFRGPGPSPFNNHNVWLDNLEGRWQGRWTLNINIQECYWPAENTNLRETNEPLLTFVESLAEAGARTARELYGARGWVAHHGTDIWMNTAPTDFTGPGMWPTAGPWLLQNLWEHYAFEPDTAYLKRLYPLLRGSSEFFLDFLIEEPTHHWLVTAPSVSPENSFFTPRQASKTEVGMGPTMDNQLLRDLFDHTIEAAAALGVDADLRARLAGAAQAAAAHPNREARPDPGVARGLRRARGDSPPPLAALRILSHRTRSPRQDARRWRTRCAKRWSGEAKRTGAGPARGRSVCAPGWAKAIAPNPWCTAC